ncbi:T9SS type A sorting domain-containing protein [Dyadobacter fanqingshengii]|uniref:T9SS type A sorting domain-containing protein n=1 Tax=Dyadobacter fanqingshengii TaxID=2906443 RepID=A0A9X1T7F2_9BACT|nr:T9SS type A sorting domain-containing protein [Dyadobacter fanqingshengii]MCF0039020.1 T9SS type A sorting domain-containing protein [Dyadobacter fanqingshengii]USJ34158.1 T9SS type A sorting domain-containing protein [Dyadobacter fanqingshengii]
MTKIISGAILLFSLYAFQAKAQNQIIKSKYGLTIYPVNTTINAVTLYPNPAALTVRFKSTKPLVGFNLEVVDQTGLSCLKLQHRTDETLDISKLPTGIYIVRFTKGKESYSQKLIVQRE